MNKLRSAFGIDDILCPNATSSPSSSPTSSKSPSRTINDKTSDYATTSTTSVDCHQMSPPPGDAYGQPHKPYPLMPTALDFAKSNFYMPGIGSTFSTNPYLDYANALKGELIDL